MTISSEFILFGFPFLSLISYPVIYVGKHHVKQLSKKMKLKKMLEKETTKFWQGPLINKQSQFAVQYKERIVPWDERMSSDIEESRIRQSFEITRFEGMELPKTKKDSDTIHPLFMYDLKWDRTNFDTSGYYYYNTHILYPNNGKPYTVAYNSDNGYVEYYGICDGNKTSMMRHVKRSIYGRALAVALACGVEGCILLGFCLE